MKRKSKGNMTIGVLFMLAGIAGAIWMLKSKSAVSSTLPNPAGQPVKLSSGATYQIDPAYNQAGY